MATKTLYYNMDEVPLWGLVRLYGPLLGRIIYDACHARPDVVFKEIV